MLRSLRRRRGRVALTICDATGETTRFTFQELTRQSARTAKVFARLGLHPGDRVAAILGRQIETWLCCLAAWRSGLVYVPLFAGFGSDAIALRLRLTEPKAVVTAAASAGVVAEALEKAGLDPVVLTVGFAPSNPAGGLDFWSAFTDADVDGPVVPTSPDDPATLTFTSGTTSEPKGCVIPHSGFVSLLPFVRHVMQVGPDDLLFSTSDPGWTYGLYTTGAAAMALGIPRFVYGGDFEPVRWRQLILAENVTFVAGAPSAYRRLVEALPGGTSLGLVRGATSAGERLDPETADTWRRLTGTPLRDGYGVSEIGMIIGGRGSPRPGLPSGDPRKSCSRLRSGGHHPRRRNRRRWDRRDHRRQTSPLSAKSRLPECAFCVASSLARRMVHNR